MSNRYILIVALISVLLVITGSNLSAQFSGGRGIDYDPFIVSNPDDIDLVREYPNSYFRQRGDISLDIEPFNTGDGWEPIGNIGRPFYGSFDGDGYLIESLYIDRQEQRSVGLFGFIHDAELKNINLTSVNVKGSYNVGGLVGNTDYSIVVNCTVEGKVKGTNYYAGGLTGLVMWSTIDKSHASGTVTGQTDIGGLVGGSTETTINKSSSSADVTGIYQIGGLVGNNYTFGGCGLNNTGGLAGLRNGTYITNSFATGNVKGTYDTGGLVGKNDNAFIYDSYARGNVDGENAVGGLVGVNTDGTVQNSFSTGKVNGVNNVGGLMGHLFSGRILRSYWDVEASQKETSPGGEGRTTIQMTYPYDENTFSEWDFEEIWSFDPDNLYNDGYPVLKWQIPVIKPYPNVASDPYPKHEMANVLVKIDTLFWNYIHEEGFTPPKGFRIYFSTYDHFNEPENFYWVDYDKETIHYSLTIGSYSPLDHDTAYYWMVVPTTKHLEERADNHTRREQQKALINMGDAEDNPVWSFTTETDTSVDYLSTPRLTRLDQNYPNPFNPNTNISFSLAEEAEVSLIIYNSRGRRVITLMDNNLAAGNHSIRWNGKDANGNIVGSGLFFYRLIAGEFEQVKKMLLIK